MKNRSLRFRLTEMSPEQHKARVSLRLLNDPHDCPSRSQTSPPAITASWERKNHEQHQYLHHNLQSRKSFLLLRPSYVFATSVRPICPQTPSPAPRYHMQCQGDSNSPPALYPSRALARAVPSNWQNRQWRVPPTAKLVPTLMSRFVVLLSLGPVTECVSLLWCCR